jgi:NTE family protein
MAKTKAGSHPPGERRKVALALQGGGAHGAFTWGVLDRMLEDPTLEIIGVTGTSAGAMNAVVLADGLVRGGPKHAKRQLRQFWETIGKMLGFGTLLWPLSGKIAARVHLEQTPPYLMWDVVRRNLSPYDLNPTGINPLREPLDALVDFKRLKKQQDIEIAVCATNVRTARRRVFTNKDISVDAVLASACLPELFPAVEIDGEAYWDGGYTGNPALVGLIARLPKCDFIIVRIDPIQRKDVPRTVAGIHDRLLEISFNSTFWLELSTLGIILRLVDEGLLDRQRFGRILFHAIEASGELEKLASTSKLNNYPAFLEILFEEGRASADAWLAKNGAAIGQRSTIDLQKLLPMGAYDPRRQSRHEPASSAMSAPRRPA